MTHALGSIASYFVAVLLLLAPLFFHEMGHWVALHRMQVPVIQYWIGLGPTLARFGGLRIGMLPIGGAVVPHPEKFQQLNSQQRIVVALAGPAASIIYGIVLWCVWVLNQEFHWAGALLKLAELNFMLAVANLIPLPPLDGFQAWVAWRELLAKPLAPRTLWLAQRAGSGLVYGVGFFVLGLAFTKY